MSDRGCELSFLKVVQYTIFHFSIWAQYGALLLFSHVHQILILDTLYGPYFCDHKD